MQVSFFSSLRWRVTLVTSALVGFVVIALMGVLTFVLGQALVQESENQFVSLLSARADQVDELANKFEAELRSATVFGGETPIRSFSAEVATHSWYTQAGIRIDENGKTVDVHDRDYFQALTSGGLDFAVGKAIISRSTGQPSVVFARRALGPDGKTPGVAVMGVSLKTLNTIVQGIKVGKAGTAWVIDSAGQFLSHPDEKMLLKPVSELPGTEDLVKALGTSGRLETQIPGGSVITYFKKIPHLAGWTLCFRVPRDELYSLVSQVNSLLLGMLLVGMILAVVLSAFLARSIVRPIGQAAAGFRHLAEGDADLTRSLAISRKDEVGALTEDFNLFLAELRSIVEVLHLTQAGLKALAENLDSQAGETGTRVHSMTSGIEAVTLRTTELRESAVESSSAVEQISRNLDSLDQVITSQAASVDQASAAIEEMAGNIGAVHQSMERLSAGFGELSVAAEEARLARSQTTKLIAVIADRTEALLAANKSIEDIAARTNMLAMNAAIEAAHGGVYGRGFAVVAGEIRKLAEGVAVQSRDVARDIGLVQQSARDIVEASRVLDGSLTLVETKIGGTREVVLEVHAAMTEQRTGADQLLQSLTSLKELTASVQTGSQEMQAGNQTLVGESLRLRDAARGISENLGTMDGEAAGLGQSAQALTVLVQKINAAVDRMDESVGRFRVK